ncbi:MAG: DUF4115 domain-containing protein [Candidatus Omnitrophica bacterium]|nr:DUF4115 domain-containing protein [Candidatus Omnitrophota bacterium]
MKNLNEIGAILEKARKEKKLSIFEVSSKTKIHETVIKQIEKGTADNALSKVYVKSFIKKYSLFLGVNSEELLADYFDVKEIGNDQKIHLDLEEEKVSEPIAEIAKYMPAIGLILIVAIVILTLIAGFIRITTLFKKKTIKTTNVIEVKQSENGKEISHTENQPKKQAEITTIVETAKQSISKTSSKEISLVLKSDQVVWIRVDQDGEVVFQGNLKPNTNETWSADKQINVRVGNLKALEITVNGQYYGNVGFGVKDLVIDKNGLKIDGQKFVPAKE